MNEIQIPGQKKLLKQLRQNNYREIVACDVNVQVAELSRLDDDDKQVDEINKFIQVQKLRRDGLIMGVKVINQKLDDL